MNKECYNIWINLIHSMFSNLKVPKIFLLCENHFEDDNILIID